MIKSMSREGRSETWGRDRRGVEEIEPKGEATFEGMTK